MFSAPLWLLGLAALGIPLALHLWSRRPRTVIRVGSLRHLGGLPEARTWSTRLTDPILLACRLAILSLTVLGLAGPKLAVPPLGSASRLVLVEPALLADSALRPSDPVLDSLVRADATVRLLEPGLPEFGSRFPVPGSGSRPNREPGTGNQSIWELLAEADRQVAPGGTIDVIARPRVMDLGGRRPILAASVRWRTPALSAPHWWLAAGWISSADSVQALLGRGDAGGVEYARVATPRSGIVAGKQLPALEARTGSDGSVHLRLSGRDVGRDDEMRVSAAAAHRVSVDAHQDTALSHRLQTAIRAVGEELGQPVSTVSTADSAQVLVTLVPLDESARRHPHQVLTVESATAAGMALADTLLARWPWIPGDRADPRQVSLTQAAPLEGPALRTAEAAPLRAPFFLLALVMIALERWLALRSGRRV